MEVYFANFNLKNKWDTYIKTEVLWYIWLYSRNRSFVDEINVMLRSKVQGQGSPMSPFNQMLLSKMQG